MTKMPFMNKSKLKSILKLSEIKVCICKLVYSDYFTVTFLYTGNFYEIPDSKIRTEKLSFTSAWPQIFFNL